MAEQQSSSRDVVNISVPRDHCTGLLDHFRRDVETMKAGDQTRTWLQSDLIQPLEQATRGSGSTSGSTTSTR
jgi:hypothetical protein